MIALIPARGGSKGLPGKNIKSLCGKPLIAYTIQAALNASGINQVVVTTDSEEIAEISRQYGAEVPFLRPNELAEDTSSAVDVYLHAIDFLQKKTGKEIQKFLKFCGKSHGCIYGTDKYPRIRKNVFLQGTFLGIPIDFVEFNHI